jgi:hypothetical protein
MGLSGYTEEESGTCNLMSFTVAYKSLSVMKLVAEKPLRKVMKVGFHRNRTVNIAN